MKQIHQIKIFVSCPSDIDEELQSLQLIVSEINKTSGRQSGYLLEILNWQIDTYTQIGEDAQDVINKQLDANYDILVGILWQKIGTPTKRDKSGTIEEINRAIKNRQKKLLVYFKTKPPESLSLINLEELAKINEFKEDLSRQGVLYKEFNSIESFESLLRINLTNLISDQLLSGQSQNNQQVSNVEVNDQYALISSAINEVETKDYSQVSEIDIFELVQTTIASFDSISNSLVSMTAILNELTSNLHQKTNELNVFSGIKDNRLRLQKSEIIVNLLANHLKDFNSRMELEKPILQYHFVQVGPNYSQLIQFAKTYQLPTEVDLKESMISFRASIEFATIRSAELLKIVFQLPLVNSKFNKSKRETEIVLKDITKIFFEGLKLIDAALQN